MLQGVGQKDETWRWHTMNILLFCKIHFQRTVTKLIPEGSDPHDTSWRDARDQLLSLLTCQTREDYFKLTALIKG